MTAADDDAVSGNVTMLVLPVAVVELVAMSATDANSNDDRTAVDDLDVAAAAAVDADDDDDPSYPASAISPLSTI